MKAGRGVIALLACVVILVLVNLSIAGKERLLEEGRVVYLQLSPVDPRSLMQGDYMALDYEVARIAFRVLSNSAGKRHSETGLTADDGRIVVRLDERSVASFARIEDRRPLAENEQLMRYRVRNGRLKFATNAFFFQEGTGGRYQDARYGMFRVNPDGQLLLTGLCDESLQVLGGKGG
jgi:uncharacterized membrane-anchored protein